MHIPRAGERVFVNDEYFAMGGNSHQRGIARRRCGYESKRATSSNKSSMGGATVGHLSRKFCASFSRTHHFFPYG